MLISPSPEPPIDLGKEYPIIYPLSRVLVTVGKKNPTPFSWFSREIFPRLRPETSPFSTEKMGTRMRPPYAPLWGGGGGGVSLLLLVINS